MYMSSITMPNAITRGRAISCCFPGVPTSAATDLFNAASGWAACCVIIIRRRRELEGPQMNFLTARGATSGCSYHHTSRLFMELFGTLFATLDVRQERSFL